MGWDMIGGGMDTVGVGIGATGTVSGVVLAI